jgi:hypothetical protein
VWVRCLGSLLAGQLACCQAPPPRARSPEATSTIAGPIVADAGAPSSRPPEPKLADNAAEDEAEATKEWNRPLPDPYLPEEALRIRKELSAVAEYPQRLKSERPARLRPARRLLDETSRNLRSGRWREEQRLYCRDDHGFVDSLAIVFDELGRIRAYTNHGGSEHSVATVRYWFDEQQRTRLMVYMRWTEEGGHEEHIVLVDAEGKLAACDRRIVRQGGHQHDLCSNEQAEEPVLDPEVRAAMTPRPKLPPQNEFRDRLLQVDPRTQWEQCFSDEEVERS